MKMLEEGDFETTVAVKGAYFLEGLKELQTRHRIIGDVDGLGLALRAEVCQEDGYTPAKATMDWIAEQGMQGDLKVAGKKYGLVLDVGGYHKNVITFAPSLLITKAEIDLALNLLDQLFTRAKKR
jgi:4-aminobutyrate aminotransferase-like enzyme